MRPVALLGALLLSACSTDVFVGTDAATGDGGPATEAGGPDAPAIVADVKCSTTTCTGHVCCTGTTWDVATCASATTENTLTCQHFLECDDSADCPAPQVCCAQQFYDATLNKNLITKATCTLQCAGSTGVVQLCADGSECKSNNCQDNQGNPSWLKTCQ